MRTVDHRALGLAVAVPDAWTVALSGSGLVASAELAPDDPELPPGLAVALEPLEAPDDELTAAQLAEQGLLHQARVLTDLRVLDEEPAELAGCEAQRTLACFRQGVTSVTAEHWVARHPRGALVVTGMAPTADYPAQHELWRAMLRTLRVDDG